MPPKRVWRCGVCLAKFRSFKGVRIHRGMAHRGRQPGAEVGARPRHSFRGEPAPEPPPFPDPWPPIDDGDVDMADAEAVPDAAEQASDPSDLLEQARAEARRMLRAPRWVPWAQDMLRWCEENLLARAERIFPTVEEFPTPETYRYLRLWAKHPGAAFASELLKAEAEEHLDLSKVARLRAHVWLICPCAATISSMEEGWPAW